MQRKSLEQLTSLRFIAAACIVFYHLSVARFFSSAYPAFANSVSFFFVLSGFVLAYNYVERPFSKPLYFSSRFARIFPLHVTTLLLAIFLQPNLGYWAASDEGRRVLVANLFLLQSWMPASGYVFSFNAVSWSISAEVFFYALFPLLLIVPRSRRLCGLMGVGTMAAAVIAQKVGAAPSTNPLEFNWINFVLQYPLMRLFEFWLGVETGRAFLRRRLSSGGGTAVEVLAAVSVLASVSLFASYSPSNGLELWLSQSGSAIAFAFLIYVLAGGNGRITQMLKMPLFVRLGEISFATYSIHQIIINVAANNRILELWPTPIATLSCVLMIYLSSYALWTLVECPMRQVILSVDLRSLHQRIRRAKTQGFPISVSGKTAVPSA